MYWDLFARSPKDFSVCYDVSRAHMNGLLQTFSSTNTGVRFENVSVHVMRPLPKSEKCHFYAMFLGCQSSQSSCFIFLEKIGSNYFVRREDPKVEHERRFPTEITIMGNPQDLYIVSKLTPAIYRQINSAHRYSIQIEVRRGTRPPRSDHERPYCWIRNAAPAESWDAVGKRFLTTEYDFRGYVVLDTCATSNCRNGLTNKPPLSYLGLCQQTSSSFLLNPSLKLLQFPSLRREQKENVVSDAFQDLDGDWPGKDHLSFQGVLLQARVERLKEREETRFRVIVDCNHVASVDKSNETWRDRI